MQKKHDLVTLQHTKHAAKPFQYTKKYTDALEKAGFFLRHRASLEAVLPTTQRCHKLNI
jgi:hypothetical protein